MMSICENIKEMYLFREMMLSLVKRDLRSRYKGSFLGFLWTLIVPLAQLIIYSFVFTYIFPNKIDNFPLFIFIGLIPWNSLTNVLNTAVFSIVNNANLVKKIYFPRMILPTAVVVTFMFDYACNMVVLLLAMIVYGVSLSVFCLWVLPLMFLQTVFLLGVAYLISALYVKMRDLQYIISIGTMLLFYVTPIVYSFDAMPERFKPIFYANPMTGFIENYRNVLMYATMPDFRIMGITAGIAVVAYLLGCYVFDKEARTFAEEL